MFALNPAHDFRKRDVEKPRTGDDLILEAWSQGLFIGAFVVMAAITLANMRRGVLLHKLILVELITGMFHGTFIFPDQPYYGWYLSSTAVLLYTSWCLHNVIGWMKSRPFLSKRWSNFYIITVILVVPYWVFEAYANFAYFNNFNTLFEKSRPYETLFRDPWWVFTAANLFYNITTRYELSLLTVIRISPRFGVLLAALIASICFIIADTCSVAGAFGAGLPDGLNPFWKLSAIFKCLTDSIILDDFKTALDRLMKHKMRRDGMGGNDSNSFGTIGSDGSDEHKKQGNHEDTPEGFRHALPRLDSMQKGEEIPLHDNNISQRHTNVETANHE